MSCSVNTIADIGQHRRISAKTHLIEAYMAAEPALRYFSQRNHHSACDAASDI